MSARGVYETGLTLFATALATLYCVYAAFGIESGLRWLVAAVAAVVPGLTWAWVRARRGNTLESTAWALSAAWVMVFVIDGIVYALERF